MNWSQNNSISSITVPFFSQQRYINSHRHSFGFRVIMSSDYISLSSISTDLAIEAATQL